jgi:hypothetical protein
MVAEEIADGRAIRLAGLPDFNATDANFRITGFDGWFATPVPDAQFAANGGYAGAIASGPWLAKERPGELRGFIGPASSSRPARSPRLRCRPPPSRHQVLANGRDSVTCRCSCAATTRR